MASPRWAGLSRRCHTACLQWWHRQANCCERTWMKLAARALIWAALSTAAVTASAQDATGAGATFPAPVYAKWTDAYNKATGARINYQSVGSGAGIKQINAKTVDFGASDAPLKDDELAKSGLV